jgi:hypothetical protein
MRRRKAQIASSLMSDSNYDNDFYAWANEQAALLRAGKLGDADIDHIAQEIESMGRTEKRELISRLRVLLLHLLKWKFQPSGRGSSWRASIRVQRLDIAEHLKDNASLKTILPQAIAAAFEGALIEAADQTGMPESALPSSCPWAFDEMMDARFWPS